MIHRHQAAARPVVLAGACSLALLLLAPLADPSMAAASDPDALAGIEQRLEARVAARPDDANTWRLLGRTRHKRGNLTGAREALTKALELDPQNAAVHFDLGMLLLELRRRDAAASHFRTVGELAPESEYADEAREHLSTLPAPPDEVVQAGYEIQRFDGSDTADRFTWDGDLLRQLPRPLSIRLESGALYNSNVALTPISRELAPEEPGAFQGFLSPQLEYRLVNGETWRAGPTFLGYFSLNEDRFRSLNVQSYQPGVFVEGTIAGEYGILVPRLQYDFNYDAFAGRTFGLRHALTASATTLWNSGDISFAYWTTDYTDFADDGILREVTSRDGWMNTLGLSHRFATGLRYLRSVRAGIDLQRADTAGTDFAFNGLMLFTETETPLTDSLTLVLQGGWGYRDYFRFEFEPSRDEHIWRGGVELRQRVTDYLMASLVFNYDRFDSKNPLFAAERFLGGIVLTFQY